ncbi:MAG: hypothetical protein QXY70_01145 [Nanopusillaceae archaeon]
MAEDFGLERNWIEGVLAIINKENFGLVSRGIEVYNEFDIVLSYLQTNRDVSRMDITTKNYLSVLSNILEKIVLLGKEIYRILISIDYSNGYLVYTSSGKKAYFYSSRIETYLSTEDIIKFEELYRRILDIIKQIVRKYCYLVIASQEYEKKKEETELYIPQQQISIPQPQIQQSQQQITKQ